MSGLAESVLAWLIFALGCLSLAALLAVGGMALLERVLRLVARSERGRRWLVYLGLIEDDEPASNDGGSSAQ